MAKTVVKGVENFNVSFYDNGYTLEYTGNDAEDNWGTVKIIVPDLDTLIKEIKRVVELK